MEEQEGWVVWRDTTARMRQGGEMSNRRVDEVGMVIVMSCSGTHTARKRTEEQGGWRELEWTMWRRVTPRPQPSTTIPFHVSHRTPLVTYGLFSFLAVQVDEVSPHARSSGRPGRGLWFHHYQYL
jgi:hypothetical protein